MKCEDCPYCWASCDDRGTPIGRPYCHYQHDDGCAPCEIDEDYETPDIDD